MTDQAMDAPVDGPVKVPRKGLSGKKLILFIIAPAVLLLGLGGAAYFTNGFGLLGKKEMADAQPPKPKQAVFHSIPDLLVNLNSSAKKSHFLKLSIAFEMNDEADIPKLQAVMPRIIDNFQVYLRELRVEDLSGASGIQRLREELLARVNSAIRPLAVKDVLFKEMLVQ